jgi:hypothetical protein
MKIQRILDLSSKIEARASILNEEAKTFSDNVDDDKQKDTVLESITRLLDLTNSLIDIIGEKELQEYNALFQSRQQGKARNE